MEQDMYCCPAIEDGVLTNPNNMKTDVFEELVKMLGSRFTLTLQQDSGQLKIVVRGSEDGEQMVQMVPIDHSPQLIEVVQWSIDQINAGHRPPTFYTL